MPSPAQGSPGGLGSPLPTALTSAAGSGGIPGTGNSVGNGGLGSGRARVRRGNGNGNTYGGGGGSGNGPPGLAGSGGPQAFPGSTGVSGVMGLPLPTTVTGGGGGAGNVDGTIPGFGNNRPAGAPGGGAAQQRQRSRPRRSRQGEWVGVQRPGRRFRHWCRECRFRQRLRKWRPGRQCRQWNGEWRPGRRFAGDRWRKQFRRRVRPRPLPQWDRLCWPRRYRRRSPRRRGIALLRGRPGGRRRGGPGNGGGSAAPGASPAARGMAAAEPGRPPEDVSPSSLLAGIPRQASQPGMSGGPQGSGLPGSGYPGNGVPGGTGSSGSGTGSSSGGRGGGSAGGPEGGSSGGQGGGADRGQGGGAGDGSQSGGSGSPSSAGAGAGAQGGPGRHWWNAFGRWDSGGGRYAIRDGRSGRSIRMPGDPRGQPPPGGSRPQGPRPLPGFAGGGGDEGSPARPEDQVLGRMAPQSPPGPGRGRPRARDHAPRQPPRRSRLAHFCRVPGRFRRPLSIAPVVPPGRTRRLRQPAAAARSGK